MYDRQIVDNLKRVLNTALNTKRGIPSRLVGAFSVRLGSNFIRRCFWICLENFLNCL